MRAALYQLHLKLSEVWNPVLTESPKRGQDVRNRIVSFCAVSVCVYGFRHLDPPLMLKRLAPADSLLPLKTRDQFLTHKLRIQV